MADFSATVLYNIRGRADAMFEDNKTKMTPPEVGVLNAITENSNAKIVRMFDEAKNNGMCTTVELAFLKDAGLEVVDNTACEFGDDEGDSGIASYELDINKSVSFTVDEEKFCSNEFEIEEEIARRYNEAMKTLEEHLAAIAIAKIEAAKGDNLVGTGLGTIVGDETYIPTNSFNAAAFSYFARTAIMNKFAKPWLLSGSNMFESVWNAEKEYGNWDGKGNFAKFGSLPIYFDLFNVDQVNDPDLKTYMIDGGTLALVSKGYYQGKGINSYKTETRWSENSRIVPGLVFDVHYTNECGTNDFMKHKFKFKMKAGIFVAPFLEDMIRTGILSFISGTAPDSSL